MSVHVFDAFGTLFDYHAAARSLEPELGPAWPAFSMALRTKQLEYAWVRSLCGRMLDFQEVTRAAIDTALRLALGGTPPPDLAARLLAIWQALPAFAEVPGALRAAHARGARLAVLSNGTPAMLGSALERNGLSDLFEAVLTVSDVGRFKTHPDCYALVQQRLGVPAAETRFYSSNRWDVAGAVAFGFDVTWVNRAAAPEEYPDLPPARIWQSLEPLTAL